MAAFHETLFPLDVALGARGGPERRTDVVIVGSGAETRNARWANSRRRWDAGYGVKGFAELQAVVAFFEERRGRLYGFRWRDRLDFSSAAFGAQQAPTDQRVGTGDGATTAFQLTKTYGGAFAPYARAIRKPVAGSVVVALNGAAQASGWSLDPTTGLVAFAIAPAAGVAVAAGFLFDVPARFDSDYLEVDLSGFVAGDIPKIPILEIPA